MEAPSTRSSARRSASDPPRRHRWLAQSRHPGVRGPHGGDNPPSLPVQVHGRCQPEPPGRAGDHDTSRLTHRADSGAHLSLAANPARPLVRRRAGRSSRWTRCPPSKAPVGRSPRRTLGVITLASGYGHGQATEVAVLATDDGEPSAVGEVGDVEDHEHHHERAERRPGAETARAGPASRRPSGRCRRGTAARRPGSSRRSPATDSHSSGNW